VSPGWETLAKSRARLARQPERGHWRCDCFCTLLALLACSACSEASDDPVDLGENTPAKAGEKLGDYAAAWDGYAEAYFFESGSDRIRMVLDEQGAGYVLLGNVLELAPGTLPHFTEPYSSIHEGFAEGFRYPAHAARVQGRRLQLGLRTYDAFTDWCADQTPVLAGNSSSEPMYYCLPIATVMDLDENGCYLGWCADPIFCNSRSPETKQYVECGAIGLCHVYGYCMCTADSCSMAAELEPEPEDLSSYSLFDGVLEDEGNELVGTLNVNERVVVRLTRMQ
jgi:hypothetical protein